MYFISLYNSVKMLRMEYLVTWINFKLYNTMPEICLLDWQTMSISINEKMPGIESYDYLKS